MESDKRKGKEDQLQRLYQKIYQEYQGFQQNMLSRSKEELYASAYSSDVIINIYEILLEHLEKMEEESLKLLEASEQLLEEFYQD